MRAACLYSLSWLRLPAFAGSTDIQVHVSAWLYLPGKAHVLDTLVELKYVFNFNIKLPQLL